MVGFRMGYGLTGVLVVSFWYVKCLAVFLSFEMCLMALRVRLDAGSG